MLGPLSLMGHNRGGSTVDRRIPLYLYEQTSHRPSAFLKGAKNRLMRCSKQAYSITWSARSNMEVGVVRMSTARFQGHHKM